MDVAMPSRTFARFLPSLTHSLDSYTKRQIYPQRCFTQIEEERSAQVHSYYTKQDARLPGRITSLIYIPFLCTLASCMLRCPCPATASPEGLGWAEDALKLAGSEWEWTLGRFSALAARLGNCFPPPVGELQREI